MARTVHSEVKEIMGCYDCDMKERDCHLDCGSYGEWYAFVKAERSLLAHERKERNRGVCGKHRESSRSSDGRASLS